MDEEYYWDYTTPVQTRFEQPPTVCSHINKPNQDYFLVQSTKSVRLGGIYDALTMV